MVSISEGGEELSCIWIRRVCELQVKSPFEVAKYMLDCFPVSHAWVLAESCKDTNGIGNVRTCGNSKIHEGSNCLKVWNGAHLFNLLGGSRILSITEFDAGVQRCGDC